MKRFLTASACAIAIATPLMGSSCQPANPCRTLPPPTAEQARVGTPPTEVEIEVNGVDCQLVRDDKGQPYWERESEAE